MKDEQEIIKYHLMMLEYDGDIKNWEIRIVMEKKKWS